MGHSSLKKAPAPRYDDPAPLGGSFVLSCVSAPESTTGVQPIVRDSDRETRRMEPRRSSSLEKRQKMLRTTRSICEALLLLVAEALEAKTPEQWERYWEEHLPEFDETMHALMRFAKRVGLQDDLVEGDLGDRLLEERFPSAVGELHFIRSVVVDAYYQAKGFSSVEVPSDKRAADFEAHARFRFYGATFSVCMVTLDYVAHHDEVKIDADLLAVIFETARHSALKLNHAVMEAASLRESTEVDDDPVTPMLIPDDDLGDVEDAIRRYEGGGAKA